MNHLDQVNLNLVEALEDFFFFFHCYLLLRKAFVNHFKKYNCTKETLFSLLLECCHYSIRYINGNR